MQSIVACTLPREQGHRLYATLDLQPAPAATRARAQTQDAIGVVAALLLGFAFSVYTGAADGLLELKSDGYNRASHAEDWKASLVYPQSRLLRAPLSGY